jgi:hypothetical protein
MAEEVVRAFDLRRERLWQNAIAIRLGLEVVLER